MCMKKVIMIIALIAAVGCAGFMFVKGRSLIGFSTTSVAAGQIILVNDSADKISVQYKVDGKDVTQALSSKEEAACGANGFVRVFTSEKSGSYEIAYPSDQQGRKLMVSQIVKAAKKDSVDGEILTEKGMVGDIKVTYEEPLELAATY